MKLLDRYVGRIALGAFGAALAFFLFLSILVDVLNNLPRYADRAARQGLGGIDLAIYLALYYVKLLPVLFTTVTPFATVIAGMFTIARLQHANEVVPMLFVGRSIHAVVRPILLLGALAGLAMAGCWQWVVPHVGAALASDETFLRKGDTVHKALVHELHGTEEQRFYVAEFHPIEATLTDVRLLVRGTLAEDVSLTTAKSATWDPGQLDWRLVDGLTWRGRSAAPTQWLGRPDLTPSLLVQQSRDTIDPETLSYSDLIELGIRRPNRADVRLAFHRHITWPLANLLLLLLALPLAVFYERRSRVERVLGAIGLCGGYMMLDLTCQSLGQNGLMHPVVAAWVPMIVFGSLGAVLFGSTRT